MRSKSYKNVKKTVATEAVSIEDAVSFVKQNARAKFDETIDVHIRLGVDAGKSDQSVRGSVSLPSGTPKQKRVAVITDDASQQKASKEAGAVIVGGTEVIDDIESTGDIAVDVIIATPNMMPKIAKVARVLGPKGLMPNPKTGTVTPDAAEAVKALAGGKVSFKMDQLGNIHESVGKVSWEPEKTAENIKTLLEAVKAARPSGQRGEFLKSVTVAATMGPGITIQG